MGINCRSRFTAEDFQFVVDTLARDEGATVRLNDLLVDLETRDAILDHEKVYHAMVDQCGCLKVSPSLYFYVLTRRALCSASMNEREIADYIAAVLEGFTDQCRLAKNLRQKGLPLQVARGFPYVSDILEAMKDATPHQAYVLRTHLGNYTLFFSGLFSERIRAQRDRRGAPDIDFYEKMGQTNYHLAARDREAQAAKLTHILEFLAARFHEVRLVLNQLTETVFHLSDPPVGIITA